ncbi:hypothetical protein RFI_30736 [Reticulomyxa filosa]|uniref:Uncharacterized protein n=1 Tax=Reticulomyxa filosa TaxID=46433 RepID=X6LZ55_RETFI|nr:hypothetical protein RFI_30736 [Reticulomyxa filosa]|eukprot:ETO06656.1 hypothetical protein RFI_30736 [Reticulomyxa filosa]
MKLQLFCFLLYKTCFVWFWITKFFLFLALSLYACAMAEDPGKIEIKKFLQVLRPKYVDIVLEQLFNVLECDDMESVAVISAEKWRSVFKEAEVAEGQQAKLLNALNEWRKNKDMKPFDVETYIKGEAAKPQLNTKNVQDQKNKKEPVEEKSSSIQGNANNEQNVTIEKKVEYGKVTNNNQNVMLPLEEKRWGHLMQDDEIQYTYTLDQNANLVMENIEWPVYQELIVSTNGMLFVLMQPHSEAKEFFFLLHWNFFFFLLRLHWYIGGVKTRVIFRSDIVSGVTKLREGDKLSFRLRFEKQKWVPADVRRIQKAAMFT